MYRSGSELCDVLLFEDAYISSSENRKVVVVAHVIVYSLVKSGRYCSFDHFRFWHNRDLGRGTIVKIHNVCIFMVRKITLSYFCNQHKC